MKIIYLALFSLSFCHCKAQKNETSRYQLLICGDRLEHIKKAEKGGALAFKKSLDAEGVEVTFFYENSKPCTYKLNTKASIVNLKKEMLGDGLEFEVDYPTKGGVFFVYLCKISEKNFTVIDHLRCSSSKRMSAKYKFKF